MPNVSPTVGTFAPLHWLIGIALRNLLGDEVSEHRELAGEVVIDTDDFFLQVRRSGRRAGELIVGTALGPGKMPALSSAVAFGLIMQVGITLPGKVSALDDACRSHAAGAILEQNVGAQPGRLSEP